MVKRVRLLGSGQGRGSLCMSLTSRCELADRNAVRLSQFVAAFAGGLGVLSAIYTASEPEEWTCREEIVRGTRGDVKKTNK